MARRSRLLARAADRGAVTLIAVVALGVPALGSWTAIPAVAKQAFWHNTARTATGQRLYAYAQGSVKSPSKCPRTTQPRNRCTLADALAVVRAGGTVLLATGGKSARYYGNFVLRKARTSAKAPISIRPVPGVRNPVIDGDASGEVRCPTVSCAGPVLTVGRHVVARITSVTIADGNNASNNSGGGGIDDMGNLNLTSVTITGCVAHVGAAVAVGKGASLTVFDSTLTKDKAKYFGGAIASGAVIGAVAGKGLVKITNSVLTDDSAPRGGAIMNGTGGTGTLTVTDSTLSHDSAAHSGGAIDNADHGTGTITITGSTFAYDSSLHGGAIDNADSAGTGNLTITASTFFADHSAGHGSAIDNGDAHGNGSVVILNTTIDASEGEAAIDVVSGSVQIASSILAGTSAPNCAGTITDAGYNLENDRGAQCGFSEREYDLVGTGPHLGPLAGSGRPPQALAPAPSSPVLEQIPNPAVAYLGPSNKPVIICPVADQRDDPSSTEVFGCAMGSVDPPGNVPAVTALDSTIGPASGGGTVTISGGNFAAGATVRFGSAKATNVVVASPTRITATIPAFAGPVGEDTVGVTVMNKSGLTSPHRPADLYRYYLADWSSYLDGTSHTSYNPAAMSISASTIANLNPIWQWHAPLLPNNGPRTEGASPVVFNGVVYFGLEDGEFYALDEATQQVTWSEYLGIEEPTTCNGAWGITSTVTVADDPVTGKPIVYVNAADGYLYALDAATGAVDWRSVVGVPSSTKNDYYAWASPTVANGKVYIGIASNCDVPLVPAGILEFDQHSGQRLAYWDSLPKPTDVGGSVWSTIAVLPDGNLVASTGNTPGTSEPPHANSLVELSPSLTLLDSWEVPLKQQESDSDFGGSPTVFTADLAGVQTTMVGACNKNGIYYAFRANDLHAGPVWENRIGVPSAGSDECNAAAVWNGQDLIEAGGSQTTMAGTTYPGSIRMLKPADGKAIWQTGLPGSPDGSASEDGAGIIAVPTLASPSGVTGVYLLSARTGQILKFISTEPRGAFAQPAFAGADLLVGQFAQSPLTAYAVTTPGQGTVSSVAPSTVNPNTTVTLTVTGTGTTFASPANVIVSGASVVVDSVQITSATTAMVKVEVLGDAVAGQKLDLTLVEPDLTAYTCTACLTVG
jgi:outer membrane protein assembly factor BamB